MNFLYVAEHYPLNGETWVRHEIETLLRRGHRVRVFATQPRPARAPHPVEHPIAYASETPTPSRLASLARLGPAVPTLTRMLAATRSARHVGRLLRAALQAAALLDEARADPPDLIVCHFAGNRSLVGSLLARAIGRPYLMIMHADDVWTRRPEVVTLVREAAEVWTIARYNEPILRQHYPELGWASLRHVRVGIDLEQFPFAPRRPSGRRIVFTARMRLQKGPDTLLEACAALAARGWTFEANMLGDGPLLAELRARAGAMGLAGQVNFLGSVPSTVVAEQLRDASAFVLPCRREGNRLDGIPVALMEAMAVGVPVVTTAVSGIPELVHDGENGMLVPPADAAALAERIERIWTMGDAELGRLVRAARETVEHQHDVRRTADELERLAGVAGRRRPNMVSLASGPQWRS